MSVELSPWRPEEGVDTPEDVASLLATAMEEGEMDDVRFALRTIAKSQGLTKVAERAGISRQGLHKILNEEGDPKLSTVLALFKALGMRLHVATDEATDAEDESTEASAEALGDAA